MGAEAKPWGSTELLLFNGVCQVNRICTVAGGYSSKHLHETKVNVFTVLRGRLMITTYRLDRAHLPIQSEAILEPGQSIAVDPWVVHRFLAIEPTEALEAYFSRHGAEVKLDDIKRFDVNGVSREVHDHGTHDNVPA